MYPTGLLSFSSTIPAGVHYKDAEETVACSLHSVPTPTDLQSRRSRALHVQYSRSFVSITLMPPPHAFFSSCRLNDKSLL